MNPVSTPGQMVARGRWADVYDVGNGHVLKRYRDPAAEPMAAFEADVMVHACAHGVPVPKVIEVRGGDLTLEHVVGPTMLQDLTRRPRNLRKHARTLAELHRIVHGVAAPGNLGKHARALAELHRIVDGVAAPEGFLHPFGGGDVLLHLDLHPDNVILSSAGPVLIDWQGAVAGPAAADVAHTWLLIRTSIVPGPSVQRAVGTLGQRLFARAFLGQIDAEQMRRHLPAVARRRLHDPTLLGPERRRIRRVVGNY